LVDNCDTMLLMDPRCSRLFALQASARMAAEQLLYKHRSHTGILCCPPAGPPMWCRGTQAQWHNSPVTWHNHHSVSQHVRVAAGAHTTLDAPVQKYPYKARTALVLYHLAYVEALLVVTSHHVPCAIAVTYSPRLALLPAAMVDVLMSPGWWSQPNFG
jgi:hypothetical protein